MSHRPTDVALVGIGCRLPGGLSAPAELWDFLLAGGDAIGDLPEGRFDLEALYDPTRGTPGRLYLRQGGYLPRIDGFDAAFFGISPREAANIDPQHRLLLECAWEAIEDAGQAPIAAGGARTGVFVGISTHDYGDLQMDPRQRARIGPHSITGTATSIAANRVSYLLDLRGPSLCVDTACSSALTAVHLAVRSVRSGECDQALAAGVQVLLTPEPTIGFCQAGMLSPTARCRPFDADADGYVRSEGCGVVVLKPLARALADGDRIYCVIRGSATNQDGRTPGMTVPSRAAHVALVRAALADAGLEPEDVDAVEAHGTGTPVGDPIEAEALGEAFEATARREPLLVTSVKSNLGHLEAAAGIAGLIKAALCVHHAEVPGTCHFRRLNPAIGASIRVMAERSLWPRQGSKRVMGVNSFGFGGANAHVLLAEAPPPAPIAAPCPAEALLLLSARSPAALREQALGLRETLRASPLHEVAAALCRRRAWLSHRLAVVAADSAEADALLGAFAEGARRADLSVDRADERSRARVVFVYSGMGPQHARMGRGLIETEPVFRLAVERWDAALGPMAGLSILDQLTRDEGSRMEEPDVAQMAGVALQGALTELLASWGVAADAIVGHSAGEVSAAVASGALSGEDGARLVFHRSRLQARARGQGGMLAAGIGESDALELLARFPAVELAATNSPTSTTLVGDPASLEALAREVERQGATAQPLSVDVPYHSAAMDAIEVELRESLRVLRPRATTCPLHSTVTGGRIDGTALDAGYWWRNVRHPVRFADAVAAILAEEPDRPTVLLEIGPHPALLAALGELAARGGGRAVAVPTLKRTEPDRRALLRAVGALYARGAIIDVGELLPRRVAHCDLPGVRWQRERAWFEPGPATAAPFAAPPVVDGDLGHPLLRRRSASVLVARVPLGSFVRDHVVQGAVVFPGAGTLELGLAAVDGAGSLAIEGVELRRPIVLDGDVTELLLRIEGAEVAVEAGGETCAWLILGRRSPEPPPLDLKAIEARCPLPLDRSALQDDLEARGLTYGPAFRGLARALVGEGEALGDVEAPEGLDLAGYTAHPALLDAAIQLLFAAATSLGGGGLYVPVAVARFEVWKPLGPAFRVHARLREGAAGPPEEGEARELVGDLWLCDADGAVLARITGLACAPVPSDGRAALTTDLYRLELAPAEASRSSRAAEPLDQHLDSLAAEHRLGDYYARIEPALEAAALAAAARCVAEVGVPVPSRERHYARLRSVAERPRPTASPLEVHDFDDPAVALVRRAAAALPGVVAGTLDGAEALFGDGGLDLLTRFYLDTRPARFANAVLRAALERLGGSGPLDVLEVGGGTGGSTRAILDALGPRGARVTFTDVSAAFVEQARHAFGSALAACRRLDLERDPPEPGERFHAIVAANVVHATASVTKTLRSLRARLAPGGALVLVEIVRHPAWLDVVFGLADGWWRFGDGRPHALLDLDGWRAALADAGFDRVEVLHDARPGGDAPAQAVFVARSRYDVRRIVVLGGAAATGLAAALSARDVEVRRSESDVEGADLVVYDARAPGALEGPDPAAAAVALVSDVARVARCLLAAERPPCFAVVTSGALTDEPVAASVLGFVRVLRAEHLAVSPRIVDVGDDGSAATEEAVGELLGPDSDEEVLLGPGGRQVSRLVRAPMDPTCADLALTGRRSRPGEALRAVVRRRGRLDSAGLVPAARQAPGPGEIEIAVDTAALNFRDVMLAMGLLPRLALDETLAGERLGLDVAGVVVRAGRDQPFRPGDEVMALASGTCATFVTTRAALAVARPASLCPAEAAAVPCAFATAHYALDVQARLRPGERVLIHSATGGVGLAALQVARRLGAEALCTAGSEEKRALLRSLGVAHVFDSRSLEWVEGVREATGGRGVDVVLSALTGPAAAHGVRALAPYGRFVEIGKRDLYDHARLPLLPFRRNLTYLAVDLDRLGRERPEAVGEALRAVARGFDDGHYRALPSTSYPLDGIEDALRTMALARHVGKVVLDVGRAPPSRVTGRDPAAPVFSPEGSVLVTGGLGGFARSVAAWAVEQGARHLVSLQRSAPDGSAAAAIAALEARGATLDVVRGDVTEEADVASALAACRARGPLHAVFHAAMVLHDAPIEALDDHAIQAAMAPKVAGAMHLHRLTRADPELAHFVLFSSIAGTLGNPTQANYAAANTFLDALARHRRRQGLPALSVAWGVLGDVGWAARHADVKRYLRRQGYGTFTGEEAAALLGALMASPDAPPDPVAFRVDWREWSRHAPTAKASRRFAHLVPDAAGGANAAPSGDPKLRAALAGGSAEARHAAVEAWLRTCVARVLGMDEARVDVDLRLADLGFDSLVAVELVTALRTDLGVDLPVMKLLQSATVRSLAATVVGQIVE